MSPRAYDRTLKQAASEEARRRIVEAAAALHAERGALGTSHLQIAERAGVSAPTVYKYFPTQNHLIPACTGLAVSKAPVALDARIFDGRPRVADRVRALADAVFRLHEYFAPWMRWTETDAVGLPALRDFLDAGVRARRELIRLALQPSGAPRPRPSLLLLAETLLDHPSWKTLVAGGLSTARAAATAADAVLTLHRKEKA